MERILQKKKGYFFTLDAILGTFVITLGIIILALFHLNVQQPTQVSFLSEDLLDFLARNKIQDLNNPYSGIGGDLWKDGSITEAENSLLQQIGDFYAKGDFEKAEKFVINISKEVVPEQYKFEVWINEDIIYPRVQTIQHNMSKNSTNLLLTSRRFTFGVLNRSTSELWGPYKAEVYLWQ